MNKEIKIITSEDGSLTIFNNTLKEHYHSQYGAVTESKHVFINCGLYFLNKQELNLLEIGFGTGLNAFLTYLYCIEKKISCRYYALEKYPLDSTIYNQLNYPEPCLTGRGVDLEKQKGLFLALHQAKWNESTTISDNFILYKYRGDLVDFKPDFYYHLIFFDAFSPKVQPELWTKNIFRTLFSNLDKEGILVTYAASGQVKRNLEQAGFTVERIPGPPGKRQIIRAFKFV